MKKIILVAMAALSMMFFVNTAYCALVTGQFSGIITEINDTDGVINGTGITENSSTFTVTYSYDTSTPRETTVSDEYTYYLGVNLTLTIDDAYEYVFNNTSSNGAEIFNDSMMLGDYVRLYGANESTETPFAHFSESLNVWLGDSSWTAFSDLSLPSSFDLADFDLAEIMLSAMTGDGSSYILKGSITSFSIPVTPVSVQRVATPIPGAVWLLGSGLFGLIGIRRKFKK